jgi:hypothetical protein
MRLVFLILISLMVACPSFAFDRILCNSTMAGWSVWNGFGTKNKVMFNDRPTTSLPERFSKVLVVKDSAGAPVIEIYPWDGIDSIVKNKNIVFELKTDELSTFELVIKTTPERRLSCRLTF